MVKHGIIGLTKYTASYWAKKNIRCNAIAPGGIFLIIKIKSLLVKSIKLSQLVEWQKNEYNNLVLFLCDKSSSYITGSVIVSDGGRTIV